MDQQLPPDNDNRSSLTPDNIECTICLSDIDEISRVTTTLCGHTFHTDCIDQWLVDNNTCPFCRTELFHPEESLLPSSRDTQNFLCIFRNNYFCYIPRHTRKCIASIHGVLCIIFAYIIFAALFSNHWVIDKTIIKIIAPASLLFLLNAILVIMLSLNLQLNGRRFILIQPT